MSCSRSRVAPTRPTSSPPLLRSSMRSRRPIATSCRRAFARRRGWPANPRKLSVRASRCRSTDFLNPSPSPPQCGREGLVIYHLPYTNVMKKLPPKFVPKNFKLNIKRSRTGRGVFAEEKIPKGACIIEYKGRPLSQKEQYEKSGKYFFETSRTTMIDGNIKNNPAKYINHSCKPNCEIDIKYKRVFVFAKRSIKAGEELTYDYDTEYFDEFIKPRGCLCNSCSPVLA